MDRLKPRIRFLPHVGCRCGAGPMQSRGLYRSFPVPSYQHHSPSTPPVDVMNEICSARW